MQCTVIQLWLAKQVWRRRTDGSGWELIDSPGNGDEKVEVQDYVKRQDQHTQSIVRQRHSIAIKQITMIFSRLSDDIISHDQYLSEIVKSFKADPSAGASQVCLASRVRFSMCWQSTVCTVLRITNCHVS